MAPGHCVDHTLVGVGSGVSVASPVAVGEVSGVLVGRRVGRGDSVAGGVSVGSGVTAGGSVGSGVWVGSSVGRGVWVGAEVAVGSGVAVG